MDFEFEAIIQRPPAAVFAFFRDIEQHAGRPGSVVPVYDKVTPEPTGVGTRYREVVRILPFWHAEVITEIVQLDPDRLLEVKFAFGGTMDGTLTYQLEPAGEGTRVIQRQSLRPRGVTQFFNPLVKLMFSKVAGRRLQAIKQILEAEG